MRRIVPLLVLLGLPLFAAAAVAQVQISQQHQIQPQNIQLKPTKPVRKPRGAIKVKTPPGSKPPTGVLYTLQEDCSFTNDGYAKCLVYDCDDDKEVCVEYGDYCVDNNGNIIPCP